MASQSPPGSPRTSEFDPDVKDSPYWKEHTPPRQRPHEGISLADMMEDYENYGDILVEDESDLSASSPPPPITLAHRPAPMMTGEEMPDTFDEPAIVTVSRNAKNVQTEADVMESIRQIAVAPPPYAFPKVLLTPNWPPLDMYTSSDGVNATDSTFWSVPDHLHQGREEVAAKLYRLSRAGVSLCTRRAGSGEQTAEAYLVEVCDLLQAALNANGITALDFDLTPTEPHEPNNPLIEWLNIRVRLAIDHALAVIIAEGAYHNAEALRNHHVNWQTMLRIKGRLQGVLQRNVKWDGMINARSEFTGDLLTAYVSQNVQMFQTVLRREVRQLIAVPNSSSHSII